MSEDLNDKERGKESRRVRDTFLRADIAKHTNLPNLMERLRKHNDVITGLDTNMFLDCIITSILLDEIYAGDFPNWILFAIPKVVMAEIENKANQKFRREKHPRTDWPTYDGRIGQRALQEMLELDRKDPKRSGMSIMTVGEMGDPDTVTDSENWWKDLKIRSQFQGFLRNISFHKGTYFASQDRVNVMMSGAEGTEGLYFQKPELEELWSGGISLGKFRRLLCELCVQCGEIEMRGIGATDIILQPSISWLGKHVFDWRGSKLRVENQRRIERQLSRNGF